MCAVVDSERKFVLEKQVFSLLRKHLVCADCAESLRKTVCDNQKVDTVLVLVELQGFHQIVFVLLGDGARQTSYFMHLRENRADLLTTTISQIESIHKNCPTVEVSVEEVDENIDDAFVSHFPNSDVRSLSCEPRLRRSAADASNDLHLAHA